MPFASLCNQLTPVVAEMRKEELGWELPLQRLPTQHLADGGLVTAVHALHSFLSGREG